MISVVIPTHNRADVIARAIFSVQNQSYSDLQIVVVSDGSTDHTKEIVTELANGDERIKYIEYFPACGGNHARNVGIQNSDGEYIAFLDDDDEWLQDKLAAQITKLEENPEAGMVYTGVNIIYENEDISYLSKPTERGDLSKKILFGNCISTTSSVLIRKNILEDVGGFDEQLRALQDYDLWIRVCQRCLVEVISEPMLNYYNCLNANQISSVTQKYIDAWEHINNKYSDFIAQLSKKEQKERKKCEWYDLALRSLRNNDKKMARQYAGKVFKLSCVSGLKLYLCSLLKYKTLLKMRSRRK